MIRLIGVPAGLVGKKLASRLSTFEASPTLWFVWDTAAPCQAAKRLSAFLSDTYALSNRLLFPQRRTLTFVLLRQWLEELPHAVWAGSLTELVGLLPSYRLTFLLPNEKSPLLPAQLDVSNWERFEKAYDEPSRIQPLRKFLPFEAVGRL
ncbi:MAG: hypothetical protein ACUVRD_04975 [Bacteroidia bacterium]